ncbi:competence/damage-inducible protein A [Roseateles depolymerans]|uniref:Molybdopterin-binding domain-containing protein n=1 Tax=Roseateles depolymerans TaxID=76731 RepID=A0A0U3DYB8_9BURK|nr:molybdopterin-binding protein [Roseateles depolymerans]ALV05845.1 Molybdopterin-binding domain-containing protein [Roseateles depolymerans]REG12883.1 molybdopterin-biosynthesis enzyme MoeA-like protein [Roseateles depolymerans]
MNIGLIIIGDEILSGKRQDKHLAKVIELLGARGLSLSWAKYLGDDRDQLTRELRSAFASGDLVFSCGGIGATPDDHTRQAAAAALDRPLALHPQAAEFIWQRVQQMAAEQGTTPDRDHPDTQRRMEMGVFPEGARIIPNPYNKIPGFSVGSVYFVPGFPVMAHPMIEWVLDEQYAALHRQVSTRERSMIVQGAMEASLTPLMERVEADFPGIKVFSLPSVDHPQWGRHIELGVKPAGAEVSSDRFESAYAALREGVVQFGAVISTEMVR